MSKRSIKKKSKISDLRKYKHILASYWDKKQVRRSRLWWKWELSFKRVKCETQIIYQSGQLSRQPDIWIWSSASSQNWKNKFRFVSILMAYKTMRLDEIAKEIILLKKWEKSSRIQPYRDLGDDNVQTEGGGVWSVTIHGVTKSQTWLSDWIITTEYKKSLVTGRCHSQRILGNVLPCKYSEHCFTWGMTEYIKH